LLDDEAQKADNALVRKQNNAHTRRLALGAKKEKLTQDDDETASFFRKALVQHSPSHFRMRQVMKHERNIRARQYPHVDEAHGLAIDQILQQAHTSMRKILGWEKDSGSNTATVGDLKASVPSTRQQSDKRSDQK